MPSHRLRLVQLGPADLPAYRALMLYAYETVPQAFTSSVQERRDLPNAWWRKRLADPAERSVVFGAWVAGNLVGAVGVEFSHRAKTRHKAHLLGMFVRPSARGQGIGRALVGAAVQEAAVHRGLRVVGLSVTEGNGPALRLYQACGFLAYGTEPMAIATTQGFLGKVHMWLPLPASGSAPLRA